MKTKNIFRMLLVAAALLMGANNVKAEDYVYQKETFANLSSTSVIRVNCIRTSDDYWQITFTTGASQSPDFNDWNSNSWGGHDWTSSLAYDSNNHRGFLLNDNHFDVKCTSSTVTKLYRDGLKITTQNLTITSLEIDGVTIGGGGGTSTTDEPVWSWEGQGNGHWLGNYGNGGSFLYLRAGTFSTLKCDGTDVIRVYGSLGDLSTTNYGIEFFFPDWQKSIKCYGTDGLPDGYYDFVGVRASFADSLKNYNIDGNCALMNGYNFYVSSIVVNPASSKADASITFSDDVELTFGDSFVPPTVTTTPENAAITYSSSNENVAYISNNTVIPVGAGEATITGSFAGDEDYNATTATYTINVNAPTRTGAVWTGAAWLGNYTIDNVGTHPQIPTADLQSAKVGDVIRFYGKLGPLGVNNEGHEWRVEIHGDPWSNRLDDVNSINTPDNEGFVKGYFDMPVTTNNIDMLNGTDNLTLNGYNLTITAVELIVSSPTKQNVVLAFSASTATATVGQSSFYPPTLTATSNGRTVTGLNITYSSSNTNVATVNIYGDVTIIASGTTIITASFSGDNNYNAAQPVNYILTVNEAPLDDDDWIQVTDISYGYRTYVTPQAIDFSRSDGVEGYYATGLNTSGNAVEFTQVVGTCPANVPLLLKAKEDATEYKLLKSSATATAPTGNKLVAGTGSTVQGDNKYVLTVHSDDVVFAEVNINGANVDTSHAYLDLSGSNARGRLIIKLNGESTGISSLQSDERSLDGTVYNLRGQRVEHPTKGIYIINGKKIVIK